MIKQKGVYPYDYMADECKFEETQLPLQEMFYNHLSNKGITQKQYHHATEVWRVFDCNTMKDYHDVYLKGDVLLLADVFEKFRKTCQDNYGLDPWDAALRMTDVNLELITDINQYKFIENGIRGGISTISTRYARANNPYVKDTYNPFMPKTYIMNFDSNNLYGEAMIKYLPTGGFRFLPQYEVDRRFIVENLKTSFTLLTEDAPKGYIFEVDCEYLKELHDDHNDYLLAPESLEIINEMYSPYQRQNFPEELPQSKLAPNLKNKNNYIVHYQNLKFYMQQGLKVTKIHRVLEFDQSPWLKKYIDFNTTCRAAATSSFEKDFYKLMNCSIFGKTQ